MFSGIQERVYQLLNEMLKDEIVDAQLAKVILQDEKLEPKISAIREYNKIRQRITEKVDLTSGGEKVQGFQMIPPHDRADKANSYRTPAVTVFAPFCRVLTALHMSSENRQHGASVARLPRAVHTLVSLTL